LAKAARIGGRKHGDYIARAAGASGGAREQGDPARRDAGGLVLKREIGQQ
jgi:hypothetical protein